MVSSDSPCGRRLLALNLKNCFLFLRFSSELDGDERSEDGIGALSQGVTGSEALIKSMNIRSLSMDIILCGLFLFIILLVYNVHLDIKDINNSILSLMEEKGE